MINIFLIALVLLGASSSVEGYTVISRSISHNTLGCYIYYINEVTVNAILLSSTDGVTFPTCPSTYTLGEQNIAGLFCATNLEQNYNLLEETTNKYTVTAANAPHAPQLFTRELDATSGTAAVKLSYAELTPGSESIWCSSAVDLTTWTPIQVGQTCYGIPTAAQMFSYCVYTNSVCSVDGECFLDTVANEVHLYGILPFFDGVVPAADTEYTFNV